MLRRLSFGQVAKHVNRVVRTCELIRTATGAWSILWLILLIALGILPVATVIWMKDLVNSLVAGIRAGGSWQTMQPVVWFGSLIAGSALLMELLLSVLEGVRTVQ